MRWVFLTLVILNLLVFALMWKKQMDAPVEKEEVIELLEGKNIEKPFVFIAFLLLESKN